MAQAQVVAAQHPEKAWVARALARALAVEAPREGILEAPRAGKDMDTRGTLQDTQDNPDTTFCDKVVRRGLPRRRPQPSRLWSEAFCEESVFCFHHLQMR